MPHRNIITRPDGTDRSIPATIVQDGPGIRRAVPSEPVTVDPGDELRVKLSGTGPTLPRVSITIDVVPDDANAPPRLSDLLGIVTQAHGAPVRIDVDGIHSAICVVMPAGTVAAVCDAVGELVGGLFPAPSST